MKKPERVQRRMRASRRQISTIGSEKRMRMRARVDKMALPLHPLDVSTITNIECGEWLASRNRTGCGLRLVRKAHALHRSPRRCVPGGHESEHRNEPCYDLDLHHGVRTAFYASDCGRLI